MSLPLPKVALATVPVSIKEPKKKCCKCCKAKFIPTDPSPKLFDKYVFQKGEKIPEGLDLRGCIGITRDPKGMTPLKRLIIFAQKVHNFFLRIRNFFLGIKTPLPDPQMIHTVVFLEKDKNPKKPDNYLVVHGVKPGIQWASKNYLNPDPKARESFDISQLYIYKPKDKALAEWIAQNAAKSAVNSHDPELGVNVKSKHSFSYPDMIGTFFTPQQVKKPTQAMMKRTALAITDLMLQKQMKNTFNKPRSVTCTGFVAKITLVGILTQSLKEEEKTALMDRVKDLPIKKQRKLMADTLYQRLKTRNEEDPFYKTFRDNPICRLNARFGTTSFASHILDQQSDVIKAN